MKSTLGPIITLVTLFALIVVPTVWITHYKNSSPLTAHAPLADIVIPDTLAASK